MRKNIVAGLIAVLLLVLVGGTLLRGRAPHVAPQVADASSATPSDSAAPPPSAASASAAPSASAPRPDEPKLDRPLRVVGMGWDLLAAGVVANDGAKPGSASLLKKQGLEVHFSSAPAEGVENALARGGADERGADVAIMPLPRFVASYEQLRALDPVIFMVVAWSEGRDAVYTKGKTLELPATGDVKLRADSGSVQAFLGLFALDVSGAALDRIKLVSKPADPWDLAVQTKRATEGEPPSGTLLFGTSEASRLVPVVAIAQASLLAKSERAVVAFGSG